MKTIIDYAKEETRSFREFAFNDVDSLILSSISYYDFGKIVPELSSSKGIYLKDINIEKINEYINYLSDKKGYTKLLENLINNPRFNNLILNNYLEVEDDTKEMQFKALTIENNDFIYISYMGTKTTLMSWKEDFNMAYIAPIPSQKLAVKYLNRIMFENFRKVYVGGHSKGGNLAVYAAMNTCFLYKHRIIKVYSFDGPGFNKEIFNSNKYKKIVNKISKFVPHGSIVGLLFDTRENLKVIKSSGFGVEEHHSLNWQVKDSDFIYMDDLSKLAKHLDKTLSKWIDNLDYDGRVKFINALFSILEKEDFKNIDITNKKYLNIYNTIRKGIKGVDGETKEILVNVFKDLAYYEKENLFKTSND